MIDILKIFCFLIIGAAMTISLIAGVYYVGTGIIESNNPFIMICYGLGCWLIASICFWVIHCKIMINW